MSEPAAISGTAGSKAPGSEYLLVDRYLRSLVGARALKSALELGVVEELAEDSRSLEELAESIGADGVGVRLLVDLLVGEQIVEIVDGRVSLSAGFRRALDYRDLLETKLDFIGFVLLDFVDRFNALVVDPEKFMREAQLFRLFDYRRAAEPSDDNYAWTKVWIRLTTALTRYEAGACMEQYDFGRHEKLLDIGGNSGEFVLQLCKRHPNLSATVVDLPVVCEFGQDHVLPHPERERIRFRPGSALERPLPEDADLITFKSMLHDWPEAEALRFLDRAAAALEPGGTLMVFERGPLELSDGPAPLAILPILMFARSYRDPSLYSDRLAALGFEEIELRRLELDTPFSLLTARKPVS